MNKKIEARLFLIFVFLLSACSAPAETNPSALHVVATTTIVSDVVQQVGGQWVVVDTLLPPGSDPHSFEPRPQDVARVADADIVFANGRTLEAFLKPLLESADALDKVVEVSEGVPPRTLDAGAHAGEADPHVWTDPNNIIIWTQNIAAALSAADPAHADDYQANAEAYIAQLQALDEWIRQQVADIPPQRRLLVTDHLAWGYFSDRYGFQQVGALIGSFSANAASSAQELAALEEKINALDVPAIFVGNTANPALAEQVAADTGVQVVMLYTGSLSGADGDAPTYLDYMRYNVTAIVSALSQ